MSGSLTDLANSAFAMLREDPITSIDDPDDPRAKEAKRLWTFNVRDQTLRAHDWNCVRTRGELNELSSSPAPEEWARAFQIPFDCLRAIRLVSALGNVSPYGTDQGIEYQKLFFVVESNQLLTNETASPLKLVYTRRDTVVGNYDALLWDAMATRLAAILAFSRVGNFKLGEALWQAYLLMKTPEAAGADENEGFRRLERYTPTRLHGARRSW